MSLGRNPAAERVRAIAIQEMCHLMTVQNLLLFVGAHPFLARQDQDPHPETYPFPFFLRPFSKEVLEDFLLAEMPPQEQMNVDQRRVMDPIIQAHGDKVHPVGLIYARLYWLFQKDDQPTAEWPEVAQSGFPPGGHIQTLPAESAAATFQVDTIAEPQWHGSKDRGGIFLTITSQESALSAIAKIATQGEGLAAPTDDQSHFEVFLDIYNTTDLTQLPIIKIPTDPFVAGPIWSSFSTDYVTLSRKGDPAADQLRQDTLGLLLSTEAGPLANFTMTDNQHNVLTKWANGSFIADFNPNPPLPALTPDELDRASLSQAVGGGFFPGIEAGIRMTEPKMYSAPFRITDQPFTFHGVPITPHAGFLTRTMACPWQSEFFECAKQTETSVWWPAQRPIEVFTDQGATIQKPWIDSVNTHQELVDKLSKLGFVEPLPQGGTEPFVEAERDASVPHF